MTAPLRLGMGVARARALRGDRLAVVDGARRFTWTGHADRIARLASGLRAHGTGPGDRVAILAESGHAYLEAYQAVPWAGGILTPVNARFTLREMHEALEDASPRVLLADAAHGDMARELAASLPRRPEVISLSARYDDFLAAQHPIPEAGRGGDDPACLFYTGGTTGRAKGVVLTHANLVCNALNVAGLIGLSDETVHLHCGPLFHLGAGGRVFATTVFGGQHVVLPRFEPEEVLRTIAAERVTIATFVPTMLSTLLALPGFEAHDLSSLHTVSYGAAPMPRALIAEVLARLPGVGLAQSYGQTELSPVATILRPRDHVPGSARLRSVGQAVPNVEVRIADAEDRPLPAGVVGEVQVRGPTVMAGYWNRPQETAAALRGGWMHTGDAGHLDGEGYLFLADRLKDMIVSGGENVYSAEVENALHEHPAVLECAVFAVPHARWGEAVHAVVVPKPGAAVTEAALLAHCRALIAGYKVPKSVDLRDDPLPRSGVGKVQKSALRAPWWSGRREPAA